MLYPNRPKDPAILFEIRIRKKFNEMQDGVEETIMQNSKCGDGDWFAAGMAAAQPRGTQTLEVSGLTVALPTEKGEIRPVSDVSLRVAPGEIVGIVGESGCGKSMTARAVMGLIPAPGRIIAGSVRLAGREIAGLSEREKRAIRGSEISMIFQEPMSSLNPVMKVGWQVAEALRLHSDCTREEARTRTLAAFREVEIPEPEARLRQYPHQLSGGLRQRVMIAMAMICRPKLLIADEPTTALDVTVEAQILRLLERLREGGTSILLISHNLGVIARVCDRVYVMYAGRILEEAETTVLFDQPLHPYSRGLLRASLSLREGVEPLETIPGGVPNLLRLPAGCGFAPRCACRRSECAAAMPELRVVEAGHRVRCFH